MIFIAICVSGFVFVCVALPFALRYESARRKLPRRKDVMDYPWPDDPQLQMKFPGHPAGPLPLSRTPKNERR
jgi:hypothetical protein